MSLENVTWSTARPGKAQRWAISLQNEAFGGEKSSLDDSSKCAGNRRAEFGGEGGSLYKAFDNSRLFGCSCRKRRMPKGLAVSSSFVRSPPFASLADQMSHEMPHTSDTSKPRAPHIMRRNVSASSERVDEFGGVVVGQGTRRSGDQHQQIDC